MWSNWQIPAFGSLVPQHETNLFTVETFTTVRCNVIPSRWAKTSKKNNIEMNYLYCEETTYLMGLCVTLSQHKWEGNGFRFK